MSRTPIGLVRCAAALLGLAFLPLTASAQNIVVVIVDDVGAEWFQAYGEQTGNPPTPTIDALAAQGVLFRTAWAHPVCSPFRISVYTGQHPFEHGAGHAISGDPGRTYVLDPQAPNLANILAAAGYRTAAVGKWHMAQQATPFNFWDGVASVTEAHPNLSGMQHFAGFLFGGLLYWSWDKTVNTYTIRVNSYATTDTSQAAISRLAGTEPFFLWVGFNAPHGVFHMPPAELLANPSIYPNNGPGWYRAMIEAMDTELGRFLQHVDLTDTTVIFVSDNGAPGDWLQPPRSPYHGKGTVYENGVRVPLIVAGQAVAASARGGESAALVQATDLFPTILEIAGLVPPARRDAVSLLPYLSEPTTPSLRQSIFTQMFEPNGGPIDPASHHRAVRGPRYKLLRVGQQPDLLFDLQLDPFELSPLNLATLNPQQLAAYETLQDTLESMTPAHVPTLPWPLYVPLIATLAASAHRALRSDRRQRPRAW